MSDLLPQTIHNPLAFELSAPPWFDGPFDWGWLVRPFAGTNITPMDFDAVVERYGHFIVTETKYAGGVVSCGQLITLEAEYKKGNTTVIIVWGKSYPIDAEIWCEADFFNGVRTKREPFTRERLERFVTAWRAFAEGRPYRNNGQDQNNGVT